MPAHVQESRESGINRSLLIPIPNREFPVNREVQDRWLREEEDDEVRALKRKIYSSINHVTFTRFMAELEACIKQFKVTYSHNTPYAVLWDRGPHKSRRWTYSLASNLLVAKPSTSVYFSLEKEPGYSGITLKWAVDKILHGGINNLVFFDDACFSGLQIDLDIDSIENYMRACSQGAEIISDRKFTYTIVAPFMSNCAKQRFIKMNARHGNRIQLITSQTIPTLVEILDSADFDIIMNRLGGKVGNCRYEQYDSSPFSEQPASSGITLTYFDHHIPDHRSFPGFDDGLIPLITPPYKDETSEYYQVEENDFARQLEGLLPETRIDEHNHH